MNYKIEKNIPISAHGKSGVWSRLATKMDIGDSILVKTRAQAMGLRTALNRFGYKGMTRTVDEGIRVWKVENKNANE